MPTLPTLPPLRSFAPLLTRRVLSAKLRLQALLWAHLHLVVALPPGGAAGVTPAFRPEWFGASAPYVEAAAPRNRDERRALARDARRR